MLSQAEIEAIVRESIAQAFDFPIDRIGPATTASDVAGWDSVSASKLYFVIEDRLGMELPIEEMLEAGDVAGLVAVLARFLSRSRR